MREMEWPRKRSFVFENNRKTERNKGREKMDRMPEKKRMDRRTKAQKENPRKKQAES